MNAVAVILAMLCFAVWAGIANHVGFRLAQWTGADSKRFALVIGAFLLLVPAGIICLALGLKESS